MDAPAPMDPRGELPDGSGNPGPARRTRGAQVEPAAGPAGPPGTADPRVEAARSGEGEAFEALVREHYPRIYAAAFRLVGNHEDAEDLAQDCFVRAHGALRWYRGQGSFAGWLRRILVHLVHDRFRAAGARPEMEAGLDPAALDEHGARTAPPGRGGEELVRQLGEALRRLPAHLRIPLVLRTLEGLDYGAIAAATGVTAATARTQVMKARRALRRLLAPYLREEEA